jgi:CHAT domain-containing protein
MTFPRSIKPLLYLFFGVAHFLSLASFISPNEDPPDDIPADIRILLEKAEEMRCMTFYAESTSFLEKAQALYRKQGNELAALQLYDKILWMAIDTDFDHIAFLKRAKKGVKDIEKKLEKYPALEAIIYLAKIQKTWIDNDIERAEEAYAELLSVLKKHPNWDYHAAGASHMANVYGYCTWDKKKFSNFTNLSIDLVNKNSNKMSEDKAYLYHLYPYYNYYNYDNLGGFWSIDDEESSLEAYNKALDISKTGELTDSLHLSKILLKIGDIYSYTEEDKAIEFFENALSYLPSRMKMAHGEGLKRIADAYITQAKDNKAILYYKKSITVLKEVHPHTNYIDQEYVDIYRSMATSYVKLGKLDKSEEFLNKIGELPATADIKPSWTHATWGYHYEYTKEYGKAIIAHEKSIEAYREEGIPLISAYWNLGNIAYAKKDYKLSTEYFHKSMVEDLPDWNAPDIREIPSYEEIPDKQKSLNSFSSKLHSYYTYVNKENLWDEHGKSLLDLAKVTVKCFEFVRNSFDRESSKQSLLETAYFTYEQAISIYLKLYEIEKNKDYLIKAFEFAEKSKSILLEDALKEENALAFGGIPNHLIEQEQLLITQSLQYKKELYLATKSGDKKAVIVHKKMLFANSQEQDKLKSILEKNYPKYYKLKYAQTEISLSNIQTTLPKGTSIIEYFEGKDNIFIFTLTSDDIQGYMIARTTDYSKELKALQDAFSNSSAVLKNEKSAFVNVAYRAYNFYDTYLKSSIPDGTNRLIIIPDGMLNYIAFEALITKDIISENNQKVSKFSTLPYLMNEFTISYNYSASMWMNQFKSPSSSKNHQLLAMAAAYGEEFSNVNRNGKLHKLRSSLAPINGTIEEINLLKANYSGSFYTKKEANEEQFKKEASNFGILHLAMHGIVNEKNPEFSSMVFTENGSTSEDNFLHANEIKQMDLHADLVVLSACETGFGHYQHGEGVVSIARSFMYAGTPSVVMTLWEINDHSSIYIIDLLYKNLQKGMEKDKALQKAKQTYLKNARGIASHPSFWAAFVQLGNYKPLIVEQKKSFNFLWFSLIGSALLLGLLGFGLRRRPKKN